MNAIVRVVKYSRKSNISVRGIVVRSRIMPGEGNGRNLSRIGRFRETRMYSSRKDDPDDDSDDWFIVLLMLLIMINVLNIIDNSKRW